MSDGGVPEALHARGTDEWCTPPEVFDSLHAEFGFTLDLAASSDDMSRTYYYSDDSLYERWVNLFPEHLDYAGWCNPPYSDDEAFVRKAAEETKNGVTTVLLVFAKTDVAWWHDVVMACAAEVRLIRGRVNFVSGQDIRNKAGVVTCKKGERAGPAPKGSCILVFRPGHVGPPKFSSVSFVRAKA